jgi:hypothetical protein
MIYHYLPKLNISTSNLVSKALLIYRLESHSILYALSSHRHFSTMSSSSNKYDGNTMGHTKTTTASHTARTIHSDAGFLLPHVQPQYRILDIGCDPGTITAGFFLELVPSIFGKHEPCSRSDVTSNYHESISFNPNKSMVSFHNLRSASGS